MFLVNSVLHRCIINQHQFTEKVFDLLRNQPEEVNIAALKHICSYRNPLYDVFTRLKNAQEWVLNNPKLIEKHLSKNDVIEVRRLIITPTKAYCLPPEVELSNRVLRHYREVSDRFLRKISTELALEVAERLQLKDNQPSAYQIRYAGCKGVVACWPDKNDENFKLSLRPSMKKFESDHTVLEICSWTRFHPGFLNRQIITLLSALNVKDEIFWDMQMKMVKKLDLMLENTDVAFDVVTASCAESGNTASIMLGSGFDPRTEPHLRGMLNSIRVAQLEDLQEKARIFVNDGRFLMGCFDELGVLEEGQCFIQVSNPSVENRLVKDGSKFMETKRNLSVIKGNVVIAKNPCLHPGDVRVLKAVNQPRLEHLVDCLIFPQKGNRPHTDEASGSDLDGDLNCHMTDS
ncbi:putative RNA-directed RNA polymerase [Helianthus annuus]|uniref:RNA-dependent RNA polymerase n=1 Tax=Helianthus annuus TaxID=4232 RepID=A0A9K3K0C2_HELAN|nr:putative RNA-directed RNA polymerase [Helianthus annuus]KAJ0959001.1 putative RNA-directed RNA polymerase [Helianthus annuus]